MYREANLKRVNMEDNNEGGQGPARNEEPKEEGERKT